MKAYWLAIGQNGRAYSFVHPVLRVVIDVTCRSFQPLFDQSVDLFIVPNPVEETFFFFFRGFVADIFFK